MPDDGKIFDYVARLTGKTVDATTPFSLGSAKKAQFAAWLRKEGVAFAYADIDRPTVTLAGILGNARAAPTAAPASAPPAIKPAGGAAVAAGVLASLRVGIDIESVANMPAAEDFRTHGFYAENFTPREIAHALQQGDTRETLCGLWAAKEAVVKAGVAPRPANKQLASVEIGRAPDGAPEFPGCALSISHEGGMAVAVCVSLGGSAP